jgi:hypothetical protein
MSSATSSLSAKHEAFAQRIASGEAASRAYTAIYGVKGATSEANASRLLRNAKVVARIRALQTEAGEKAGFERADAIKFLVDVLRTPVSELHPSHPLCQSFHESRAGNKSTLHVQMPSKIAALEKLARLRGWYEPEKKDLEGKLEIVIRKL